MKINLTGKQKICIIFICLIAVAILVFAFVFKGLRGERNYAEYMLQATECMNSGEYENAIALLRKAAAIEDTDECLLKMADCYEKTGNYEKALEILRLLNVEDPQISTRIAVLENKSRLETDADKVTVAGEEHKTNETVLVVENQNLGNSLVQEAAQLYSLNNLSLAGNNITDISPLVTLGGLSTLNLSNNSISDISVLSKLNSLRTLYLDNNPIENVEPLKSIPSLRSLSLKGINLSSDQLKELSAALPNCAINGEKASTGGETITIGGETFEKDITKLDLSGRGIIDISALSVCERLSSINLSNNAITDITPLMDIPNIVSLNISGNNVSDLRPLMGLGTIKVLNAADNNISSTVSLGANTALQELNLSGNTIGNFSGLRKLKNLTSLNIANTGFTGKDIGYFQYLSKLLTLNITDNEITGEEFDALQSMLPVCAITHSDLVYTLDVDGFQVPSNTTDLNLNNTGITDITPILKFPALERLQLAGNGITDIYPLSIYEGWRSLKELNLSNNNIEDYTPVLHLGNLEILNLSDNKITNITDLCGMTWLKTLYIGGNQLTEEQIAELNRCLPNCEIIAW